ncbi:MAG: putative holin-like toxin [Streptococcaceae bacterium]|nr:putative holin-like toxin [Streptococcaceae bacterium]
MLTVAESMQLMIMFATLVVAIIFGILDQNKKK